MSETSKLGLPLLLGNQAQKHVTVNEALSRIDGLVQMVLSSEGGTAPPNSPAEGEVHAVGTSATGLWSGADGTLAIFQNGGWVFVVPQAGWQGWSAATGTRVLFDGSAWIEGAGAISEHGAEFVHRTSEVDHDLETGASSTIAAAFPEGVLVYGITGRVISAIGGAASFEIGVSGSTDRYGSGIGTGIGSWARGMTGSPLAYFAETDLILTSAGGNFDGTGTFRIAVHYAQLTLPRA